MLCRPGTCAPGLLLGRGRGTFMEGAWSNNPVFIQILGICSCLAVTSRLETSLVMGGALIFTTAMSNTCLSLLRNVTPRNVRMIAEMTIISTFVIVFDQFLKGFYWDMSKQLGPYVGLIITNCILMGRAEAFALRNPPLVSLVDGAANGLGYACVLAVIGFLRELVGTGKILGHSVLLEQWYTPNQLMILAPGAFFALGLLMALFNWIRPSPPREVRRP